MSDMKTQCNTFLHGRPLLELGESLGRSVKAKEKYCQVPPQMFFWQMHMCMSLSTYRCVTYCGEYSNSQPHFCDKLLHLFILLMPQFPFLSPCLLQVPSLRPLSRNSLLTKNVSDENNMSSALSSQTICCACLHTKSPILHFS